MAEALADCGADLVLCARKAERCVEAARELAAAHGGVSSDSAAMFAIPPEVAGVADRTVAELGRIDYS